MLLLPVLAQAASAQSGQLGVRLLEAPAERADDPRALTSIIDHLNPGEAIARRMELVSTVSRPVDVRLYPGNANIEGGQFVPDDARAGPAASWVSVTPERHTVPANGAAEATISIEVPTDAPEGEYYAVVWSEPPPAGENIQLLNRVGIRIYLSVGPGGEPASDFEVEALTAQREVDGSPLVRATIVNTGGRAIDVAGELSLSDGPAGLSAGPFGSEGTVTLGVGERGDLLVPLPAELPAGPWLARLTAQSGLLERAAEATIVFPDTPGESAEPVEATEVPLFRDRGFLLPVAVGLVILLLILFALFWWFFVVKRRKDDDEDEDTRKRKAKVGG